MSLNLNSTLIQLFSRVFLLSSFLPILSVAQFTRQESTQVDSVTFITFLNNDTSFSNYLTPDKNVIYRKSGSSAVATLLQHNRYRVLMHEKDTIKSKFQLDEKGVQISAGDTGVNFTSVILTPGKAEINASETWFNGNWIKIPTATSHFMEKTPALPAGGLFYSENTRSLAISDGNISRPAYWEYPDSNDINPSVLLSYWAREIGYHHLPLLRIRHPLNTTGILTGSISRDQDLTIIPYQYGMAIDYNGVLECWVGEFSIHKGLHYNIDVEGNGGTGWGGVFWVGDDLDIGGLRATSRNDNDVLYSEVSSETFGGSSHGTLRLRVVDTSDQIQFVHGKRGSADFSFSVGRDQGVAVLSSGPGLDMAIHSGGMQRLYLSKNGNMGAGVSNPTSKLDLSSDSAYNQLRLRNSFTPSGSADNRGEKGDIAYDDEFIYIKTSGGWKRARLEIF